MSLSAARAAYEARQFDAARRELRALVGVVTANQTMRAIEAYRLARLLAANDLALHFALCFLVATGGGTDAVIAVSDAASEIVSISTAGQRVRTRSAAPEDWAAIAQADALGEWPEIAQFAAGGLCEAIELDALAEAGSAKRCGVRHESPAWRLGRSRITWNRHGLAVAAHTTDGRTRLLPELCAGGLGAALRWSTTSPANATNVFAEPLGMTAVLCRRYPFHNYYHWLIEGLSDVITVEESGVTQILVLTPTPAPDFVRDSIELLGLDPARFVFRHEAMDIEMPSVVRLEASQPRWRDVVELLRSAAAREQRRAATPRRLFVSRRDAGVRRLVNEDETFNALRPLGFQLVVPGELSFREQASLFASAEAIVGTHGAGMTNMAFAPPNAAVVELLPTAAEPPICFLLLADAAHHQYQSITCDRAGADLTADPAKIAQATAAALRASQSLSRLSGPAGARAG